MDPSSPRATDTQPGSLGMLKGSPVLETVGFLKGGLGLTVLYHPPRVELIAALIIRAVAHPKPMENQYTGAYKSWNSMKMWLGDAVPGAQVPSNSRLRVRWQAWGNHVCRQKSLSEIFKYLPFMTLPSLHKRMTALFMKWSCPEEVCSQLAFLQQTWESRLGPWLWDKWSRETSGVSFPSGA